MQGAQPSALWQPRGVGWGGRWERGSRGQGMCILVVGSWWCMAETSQYCKAIILQKKKKATSAPPNNNGLNAPIKRCRIEYWENITFINICYLLLHNIHNIIYYNIYVLNIYWYIGFHKMLQKNPNELFDQLSVL